MFELENTSNLDVKPKGLTRGPRHSDGIMYFPAFLLHAGLPLREPVNCIHWGRMSQGVELRLISGVDSSGKPIGLPYGSIARLLIAWLCTEAKRANSPEIRLGTNVGTFMWSLGLPSGAQSGGTNGGITRVKKQMRRLFGCDALIERRAEGASVQGQLWTTTPDLLIEPVGTLLTLSEHFMAEIASHSVPIRGDAFKSLSMSPLAMDVYCWLTWRFSFLRFKQKISWEQLHWQFGSQAQSTKKFKELFLNTLDNVRSVYPEIGVVPGPTEISLIPSRPSVPNRRYGSH